jgi:hypothetical protein
MSEDLGNEVSSINAIYGDDALERTTSNVFVLKIPSHPVSLRLQFPEDYPSSPPSIAGVESTGDTAPRGYGTHVLALARDVLSQIFHPTQVCLFDLIQELEALLSKDDEPAAPSHESASPPPSPSSTAPSPDAGPAPVPAPEWTLSAPLTVHKSVFLARACRTTTLAHARSCISHLLATDRHAARATHNLSAFRIRGPAAHVT